jgi:hypothetical protein
MSDPHETRPPELHDMLNLGMPLPQALHLQHVIDANPDVDPNQWWLLICPPAGTA